MDAATGTKVFKMRLVEMVAVSLHQIAAYLFNSSPKSHPPEYIKHVTEWQRPTGWVEERGGKSWQESMFAPPQTHFLHTSYTDYDLYPNGVADMAGYWAEDRIFGGVVLFDRGDSGHEVRSKPTPTTVLLANLVPSAVISSFILEEMERPIEFGVYLTHNWTCWWTTC